MRQMNIKLVMFWGGKRVEASVPSYRNSWYLDRSSYLVWPWGEGRLSLLLHPATPRTDTHILQQHQLCAPTGTASHPAPMSTAATSCQHDAETETEEPGSLPRRSPRPAACNRRGCTGTGYPWRGACYSLPGPTYFRGKLQAQVRRHHITVQETDLMLPWHRLCRLLSSGVCEAITSVLEPPRWFNCGCPTNYTVLVGTCFIWILDKQLFWHFF